MKFSVFLLALVEPLIGKILITLGFSLISIVGVDASLNQVKSMVISNMSGLGSIIDFALFIWLGKGLGIVFGAMTTKLMLWNIHNATKILGKNTG